MRRLAGALLLAAAIAPCTAWAQGFYRLESVRNLPGAHPEWDYVTLDAAHDRLFIGRRGAGVTVVDLVPGKGAWQIANSQGANAVALVPASDRGYTANEDGSTTVFRLSDLKTIERIRFGEDADSAFLEPGSQQLAFTMGDSHRIKFLDSRTGKETGELAIDSSKIDGTLADGQGHLLAALRDRDAIVRIDAGHRKLLDTWATAPCEQPTSVALDREHRRLFVGCRGAHPVLAVLDADTGKVVATQVIGRGNDGVVYDGARHRILASNGVDANLVVVHQDDADHYRLEQAVTTRPGARTMAYDERDGKVYLVTAEGVVDPALKINTAIAPLYPNRFHDETFVLLTYTMQAP